MIKNRGARKFITHVPAGKATAGPPADPDWQQKLSSSNPIVEMLERGKNMTPEERKAAEEERKKRLQGSFGGAKPF